MTESRSNGRLAALIFGTVLTVAVFAWWMSLAPWPLPADAPPEAFSAYRALKHIQATAVEPHPAGSRANELVYDYIAGTLEEMGVEMTVERQLERNGRGIQHNGAILARLPGIASTGAFAVDAHFDSTPYGPGAADDISGIAAMLESIRALKAGPPLMNDIIFCFVDEEERGGGGPGLCMRHPWFADVRAVLGLETRGTSGPALMFETGQDNGFVIRQLAQSESKPRATSIMFDFYDRMPFGSDFGAYKREGFPGLNIAYIDDFAHYHTKLDNPENVSLASVQHHGEYILGLARQLGGISLQECRAPNAIYFNTIGSHMVVYPGSWGLPITLAAAALFAAVLLFGLIRRRLTVSGILGALGLYPLTAVISLAVTAPLSVMVYYVFKEHALYRNDSLSAGMILFGIGVFVLLAFVLRRRIRPQNLLAGTLAWWLAILVAFQYFAPYGSYGAAWPLVFGSLGLLVLCLSEDREHPSDRLLLLAAVTVLPAVALLTPSFVMFSYALTALLAPVLLLAVLLVVAMLLPQCSLVPARIHLGAGLAITLAGALVFTLACLTNTPSGARPRQNCLSYAVNFDTGEAWWVSSDVQLDEWTRNYFPKSGERVSLAEFTGRDYGPRYRRGPAPMPPFDGKVLTLLEERVENGRRLLKFLVDSPRDAQEIHIRLESDVPVYRAKAFGHEIEGAEKNWDIRFETLSSKNGELELETDPGTPIRFHIREVSWELPGIPGFVPRPDHFMVQPNRVLERRYLLPSNHTYSICTQTF
ncbi:MAG: M20/M25/M40 family metallo-hydrolase [Candidatus Hydrogenedentes bacterium]|nr:M20/M25/M40 family metallo-hydrolase [Candidatus Hydrogenedentota bacterium]